MVVYQGTCTCGEKYIGETKRCEHVRFEEHNNPKGNSEPARHLRAKNENPESGTESPTHSFEWTTLTRASPFSTKRRILEGLLIAKSKPSLNEQVNHYKLHIFRNGITKFRLNTRQFRRIQ